MNYYPFHLGDYAAHTAHLEPMEDLAYRRLLDQYYLREGALPADIQVTAKLVRMRSMAADVEAVLREFFVLTEAGWRHSRCDSEIAEMCRRQQVAKDKANKRWHGHAPEPSNAAASIPNAAADAAASKTDAVAMLPTPTPTPTPVVDSGSAQAQTPPPAYRGEANEGEISPKAKVLIAPEWELPEPWGVDAENLGWPAKDILREAEKFRQFYTVGKGGGTRRGLKGWRQSWSNWLSNAERFAPIRRVA